MTFTRTHLARAGLTNRDTADLGELAFSAGSESVAYCNSLKCTGQVQTHSYYGVQKKTAKLHMTDCPDCSSALFWRTIPKRAV